MARILVTGGAGFIGSHLVRALVNEGYEPVVVDDLSTGRAGNLPQGVPLIELDLGDPRCLPLMPDGPFTGVLHLAGQSSGEASFDDPLRDFAANALSSVLLGLWCLRQNVPVIVHASSMGVYGAPRMLPVREDHPCRPISFYGSSKLAAERWLAVAARPELRVVGLRMFNVYGPGQDLSNLRQGMVSIYLAQLLRGGPVVVKGSLGRVRDFVFVEDVVEGWMSALRVSARGNYNLASGVGLRVSELLELLCQVLGVDPAQHPVHQETATPGDPSDIYADVGAIRRDLGWTARTPLPQGLERMVAWARRETCRC